MELVPGLDLRRGQRHRCAMTNAMKGDLLDASQDVVEVGVDEGDPGIDGCHSHVRRQCTVRAGDHKNKRAIKIRKVEVKIKVSLESILLATMASDSASHARAALASSSAARRAA